MGKKRKLEAINNVLQFDKTQEIPPSTVLMSTLVICLWLAIYHFSLQICYALAG